MALLEVKDLTVCFRTRRGIVRAVDGVSYTLERGRTLGIVGESGSGKSVSAMSILRLSDENAYIAGGEILFEGRDLVKLPQRQMYDIRGNRISVIFQEPMTSLNPVLSIGRQISEPYRIHRHLSRKAAMERAREMLAAVQIPDPSAVCRRYPHQLSGGMRQRVMIAMALACRPQILIADEPTTALDVTIQAQILRLMRRLQAEQETSILFITHDLGVINEMADDVAVLYCGQVVEHTPACRLFTEPAWIHPYTEGLLDSVPQLTDARRRPTPIPGNVPHPLELPQGCRFAPRCRYATERCIREKPRPVEVAPAVQIRCFYPSREERQSAAHRATVIHHGS